MEQPPAHPLGLRLPRRSACPWRSRSALATATTLILAEYYPLMVLLKETFTGIDSFPLMAVPFFILAAELMSGGSLTEVLLRFAGQFVGHQRGGLGYTNVVSLTFFSGISGSALADAAGPGLDADPDDGQGRLRPRRTRRR